MRLGFLRIIHIRGPPVYRFEFDSPLRELKEGSRLRDFPPSDGAPVWNSLRFRKPHGTEFDALRARQFFISASPLLSSVRTSRLPGRSLSSAPLRVSVSDPGIGQILRCPVRALALPCSCGHSEPFARMWSSMRQTKRPGSGRPGLPASSPPPRRGGKDQSLKLMSSSIRSSTCTPAARA
jgi:hypothetical protein